MNELHAEANPKSRRWLGVAALGSGLAILGSVLVVVVHATTRNRMRELLTQSQGRIESDELMLALHDVMTRGLLLSIGSALLAGLGILLGIAGLVSFFVLCGGSRSPAELPPEGR